MSIYDEVSENTQTVQLGVSENAPRRSAHEELYDNWLKDKSRENMSRLVESFSPTINSEITRYEGSRPLLRSRAKALTISAIKNYDPSSGARLNSWIVTNLKQLSRYGKKQRDVHIPEVAARQAAIVDRATREFRDDYGRDPTDDELADELGITPKRVAAVRKMAVASVPAGQFDEIETGDGDSSISPAVTTPSPVPFAQDAVYMSLNNVEKEIFDSITGSHGRRQVPASSVAARLGISPARVSQIASSIANRISEIASIENGTY